MAEHIACTDECVCVCVFVKVEMELTSIVACSLDYQGVIMSLTYTLLGPIKGLVQDPSIRGCICCMTSSLPCIWSCERAPSEGAHRSSYL